MPIVSIILIGIGGILASALMLMFLADTIVFRWGYNPDIIAWIIGAAAAICIALAAWLDYKHRNRT